MTCPYHDEGSGNSATGTEDRDEPERGLDGESLTKAALAIGGGSALSTVAGLYGLSGTAAADSADGRVTVAERNNRQHAWDAYERFDERKETSLPPESQLLPSVDYVGAGDEDGVSTSEERRTVADALDKLKAAFGWSHEGLLFTVGYSPNYSPTEI